MEDNRWTIMLAEFHANHGDDMANRMKGCKPFDVDYVIRLALMTGYKSAIDLFLHDHEENTK